MSYVTESDLALELKRLRGQIQTAGSAQGPAGPTIGVPTYVQMTPPTGSGYVWFQTDSGGSVIDILVG